MRLCVLLGLVMASLGAGLAEERHPPAAPTLSEPSAYCVFQRGDDNRGVVRISGTFPAAMRTVEAQAESADPEGATGKRIAVPFQIIARPNGNAFNGELRAPAGGWYHIRVRGTDAQGAVSEEASVPKVGVGEVFFCAGHSFCSNYNGDRPGAANDDRVATIADWTSAGLASPLTFRHAEDPLRPGDANLASPWPLVGDRLVQQLQMPVMFICCGTGGSTVEGWAASAANADPSAPYDKLYTAITKILPITGVRAILWFGNENDLDTGPAATLFAGQLRTLMGRTRADAKRSDLAWLIAFDAYDPGITKKYGAASKAARKMRIDQGVNLVLESDPACYEGPQTDDLGPEFRSDGDHFNAAGLREVSRRFSASIHGAFFDAPVVTVGASGAGRGFAVFRSGTAKSPLTVRIRMEQAGRERSVTTSTIEFATGQRAVAIATKLGERQRLTILAGTGYGLGRARSVENK